MANITVSVEEEEEINDKFNEQLESLTPENADNKILYLGKPSNILLSVGIEDKTLKLYGNKIIKKQNKHGFELSNLKDLPKAVANPIAVFKGNRLDTFAIMTEIEIKGNIFFCILEVGKGSDIQFNIITSVHAKGEGQITSYIDNNKLLYLNKEKAPGFLHSRIPSSIEGAQSNRDFHL